MGLFSKVTEKVIGSEEERIEEMLQKEIKNKYNNDYFDTLQLKKIDMEEIEREIQSTTEDLDRIWNHEFTERVMALAWLKFCDFTLKTEIDSHPLRLRELRKMGGPERVREEVRERNQLNIDQLRKAIVQTNGIENVCLAGIQVIEEYGLTDLEGANLDEHEIELMALILEEEEVAAELEMTGEEKKAEMAEYIEENIDEWVAGNERNFEDIEKTAEAAREGLIDAYEQKLLGSGGDERDVEQLVEDARQGKKITYEDQKRVLYPSQSY